jgi:hypothetical protein
MMNESATICALYDDLEHYLDLALKAADDKHEDLRLVFGMQFHNTANRIAAITGIDPREPV